jgi:acyl-CoA synthetase (NDP forming)
MRKFFDPKSVVVVGVPRKTGAGAYNNVDSMINYVYKGYIYPVNPKAEEICGCLACGYDWRKLCGNLR